MADRTVGPHFDGCLPWECIDNRPFYRALHGLGTCQWRLGDIDSACRTFARLASLHPSDPLDGRFLAERAGAGQSYLISLRRWGLSIASLLTHPNAKAAEELSACSAPEEPSCGDPPSRIATLRLHPIPWLSGPAVFDDEH